MAEFFRNVLNGMAADPAIKVAVVTGVVGLCVALVTGGISLWISWRSLGQTRKLAERQNDLNLLERFAALYFGNGGSRPIALYVVDKMFDPGLQRGLRRFVHGQMLGINFGGSNAVSTFNKDHADWGMLGDALFNLRKFWNQAHEMESFGEWWCSEQQAFLRRWPRHDLHLRELFSYLDDRYLHDRHYKNVRPTPATMLPCGETPR